VKTEMRNLIFWCFRGWLLLMAVSCGAAKPATQSPASEARSDRPSIEWEFKLDPLDVGRAEKWFEGGVPYRKEVMIPADWKGKAPWLIFGGANPLIHPSINPPSDDR
jgi:hypothetical protein